MTAIKNGTLLVKDSNGNTARVATLSQTDITTLNTALTDIEANKKKINSISANYVTTNTAQTISGAKTFSAVTKSATPASNSNDTSVATTAWVRTVCPTVSSRVSVVYDSGWIALVNRTRINIASLGINLNNINKYLLMGMFKASRRNDLEMSTLSDSLHFAELNIDSNNIVSIQIIGDSDIASYKILIYKLW